MKKNKVFTKTRNVLAGVLAMALTFGLVFAGCGKKDSGGGGGKATAPSTSTVSDDAAKAVSEVKDAAKDAVKDIVKAATGDSSKSSGKATSEDAFQVELTKDGTVRITKYLIKDKNVVIPATIQGMPVTEIGYAAFEEAPIATSGITSIVIPEGVKVIGESAFRLCKKLTSVTLPSTLTTIGREAFTSAGIKNIVLPDSVTKIGPGAFQYTSLTSIKLPAGLKVITDRMFESCDFTEFEIPEGVTTVEAAAFQDCDKLTKVTFPSTIKAFVEAPSSWSEAAFKDCENLTTVTIPDSVANISWQGWDFTGCKKMSLASQAALKKRGYTGSFTD